MGRTANKSMSIDERMKQNYILQLVSYGVNAGPKGESLQSIDNGELCRMVTKESLKRD